MKIAKKWRKDPEALAAALERLMDEYSRRANKCITGPDGLGKPPNPRDVPFIHYCEGTTEGLNKAYKLIFGYESEKTLKS